MEAKSGAVLDHEEAEAERAEAERIAEDEALAAAAIDETPGTPDDDPDAEPADEPAQEPGDGDNPSGQEAALGEVELVIDAGGQLSFAVGGKKPTGSSIRLTGGKISIPSGSGQLHKGDDVVLRVVARVAEVAFVDELDPKTQQVVGSERRHKARIINVGLLSE